MPINRTTSQRALPRIRQRLGATLRTTRHGRGLSQEDLGAKAGLSGKFIGEVERGEKSISVDSLYRLASALRVRAREVLP
jgi:transcriptional regulator with XRE-family HTH domain